MIPLPVTFKDFEKKFLTIDSSLVRVFVDRAIFHARTETKGITISKRNGFSPKEFIAEFSIYAPWHINLETGLPAYPAQGTRPILLNQIHTEQNLMKEDHRSQIASISNWYRTVDVNQEIHVELVTVGLHGKRLMVLDGNHRLSALIHDFGTGVFPNVVLTEYRIEGKDLTSTLFPDILTLL